MTADTDYVLYTGTDANPYTFRVAFKNIKGFTVGTDITVNYSATVNENAVIGGSGNPNTTDLTYSNNPNDSGHGNPSDNPKPDNDVPTGTSGEDKTITYVAELILTKYKDSIADANKLQGAQFTLTGTSTVVIPTTATQFEADANGDYYKLSDGTFTLTAPHGDILRSDGTVAVTSNESHYAAEALGENPTKYSLKTATTFTTQSKEVVMQGTTDANGVIDFKGLGAGTYTLKETVTPQGYTTAQDITFTIVIDVPSSVTTGAETAEYSITAVTPSGAVTLRGADATTGKATTGVYETRVIDLSGSTLPSTGGIGTTIFYVGASILVLAAAILLITKRRMGNND